jgi:hypothetical protein
MTKLQLFDSVRLRETVILAEGEVVPAGTRGAVVELLADGEATMVELFGDWVKVDSKGNLVPASADDPEAFAETLGVVTVPLGQIELLSPAEKTTGAKTHLLAIVEDLPEQAVVEVADFAEFLRQKQKARQIT